MKSFFILISLTTSLAAIIHKRAERPHVQNANHIFNAIHSSMRQWGSSLNHNGMSVFLATVPQDVELYHGTDSETRINGTEWLAFEPEHAMIFARGRHGPPPDRDGERYPPGSHPQSHDSHGGPQSDHEHEDRYPPPPSPPPGPPDQSEGQRFQHPPPPPHHFGHEEDERRNEWEPEHLGDALAEQRPIFQSRAEGEEPHGYLHTYRTKHPLRLLYVDGQSAAKSEKGTLDVQDMVLLHQNPPEEAVFVAKYGMIDRHEDADRHSPPSGPQPNHDKEKYSRGQGRPHFPPRSEKRLGPPHGGPLGEGQRAERLCQLAQTEYEDRIDGILRMEGGFEIILCDMAKHLDVISIARTKPDAGGPGPGRDDGDMLAYYRAVAARYDGIGAGRVTLDYENFVSLFAIDNAVFFDESRRPRVRNETKIVAPVKEAIKAMALKDASGDVGKNWQAITDMVVARYADPIAYLASGELNQLHDFKAEADHAMRPFIDYGDRNTAREIERCSIQHLPSTAPSNANQGKPAYDSIHAVTSVLCRTLSAVGEIDTLAHGVSMLRGLKSWLGWTTWKRCRGCAEHEVCFLPIWPAGSAEDFEHPQCRSHVSGGPGTYWGGFGKPPRSHDRP
ncbi:hypothetical protein B0A50_00446 [Salinomyces thailandicus]|uniref:Uncharacterized protein n=1 Tax=Salinomyces thailandicus TaxID=706561 RepID=A0A4U0UDM4_9PEZI|nr:hypothetical protein B0A50_00446 [Salinomyces thailandica]